ncbi:hypothetical protein [Gordonia sp. KTR9]|uniref:hypothetical protein n=1 Tax=Gordonia sp. KTR9 TaxID=337191 RepID=UPI0002DC6284|nr:hypothetical protein [Gordonia sp. KTR9]
MTLDTAQPHRLSVPWLHSMSDVVRGAAGVVVTTAAFLVAVAVLVIAQIVVVAARAAVELT